MEATYWRRALKGPSVRFYDGIIEFADPGKIAKEEENEVKVLGNVLLGIF